MKSAKTDDPEPEAGPSESDALLKEIFELGGDEDDFDICANVQSDSEADYEDGPALSKGLREQLLELTSQLGFEKERAKTKSKDNEVDVCVHSFEESKPGPIDTNQGLVKQKASSKLVS